MKAIDREEMIEFLKEVLTIRGSTKTEYEYGYGGDTYEVKTFKVELLIDGEVISTAWLD